MNLDALLDLRQYDLFSKLLPQIVWFDLKQGVSLAEFFEVDKKMNCLTFASFINTENVMWNCRFQETIYTVSNFWILIVFVTFVFSSYKTNQIFFMNLSQTISVLFDPFHFTDLFWYPLKTSKNLGFSDVFRGYQKREVAWNGLRSY